MRGKEHGRGEARGGPAKKDSAARWGNAENEEKKNCGRKGGPLKNRTIRPLTTVRGTVALPLTLTVL